MATRINLLPWREELRQQRQREFILMLVFAAIAGAALWWAVHLHLEGRIAHQENRNEFLRSEIQALEKRIVKIRDLEETKEQLLGRMQVIQDLQQGRPQIVHLFEQLTRTVPEGLYLTNLGEQSERLRIEGIAESNGRISNYMEQLDASAWLADPNLEIIRVEERNGQRVSTFTLQVSQTNPQAPSEEDSGNQQRGKK